MTINPEIKDFTIKVPSSLFLLMFGGFIHSTGFQSTNNLLRFPYSGYARPTTGL
jgi:hypothetical protein